MREFEIQNNSELEEVPIPMCKKEEINGKGEFHHACRMVFTPPKWLANSGYIAS